MNRLIRNSGKEWRYHVTGNGAHPLLILCGSLGATEGIASYLGEQLTGYRLIVPEYTPAESIEQCLDALDCILEQEQIVRFAILGGSFGGLIAQSFARRHPDRITHLILAGTSPPDSTRVRANERAMKILRWIPPAFIRTLLKILLNTMLRRVHEQVWKQEYSKLISRLSKADIVSRYQVAIDLDRSYRFHSADLGDLIKVLILEGEKDRIANSRARTQLREIYPNARIHVFRGAGHSSMMSHTKEWVKVVQSFLTI